MNQYILQDLTRLFNLIVHESYQHLQNALPARNMDTCLSFVLLVQKTYQ